ncbi:hypothetical protein FXO38_35562 [Capsicum annuum]|nr:hypothetical protein FXO38_35562 [Capsicum annuum]KAF3632566.1 hypothetical protein FXO37_27398 [Capsicum annuum]
MVFDEASSWWSSNKKLLPDSDVLKDELDLSHIQLSLDEAEGEANEDNIEEDVTQSPWQQNAVNYVFINNKSGISNNNSCSSRKYMAHTIDEGLTTIGGLCSAFVQG